MISRKVKLNLNRQQTEALKELSQKCADLFNTLLQTNLERLDEGLPILSHFDMNTLCSSHDLAPGVGTQIVNLVTKRVYLSLRQWQESQNIRLKMWLQYGPEYKRPMKAYLSKAGKKLWGKPRFKKKGISIQYGVLKTQQKVVKVYGKVTSIRVPLIGVVKGRNDRQELIGNVKQVTISRDACGTWWGIIVCDGNKPREEITSRGEAVGVDLGLKHTITAANDQETIQPERERFLEIQMAAVKKASRQDRRALPFIHRKIARRRKHSHHVQAKRLIQCANNIYVGNLNSGFLFSGKLARSASDAAHSQFLTILSYKAENAGKMVTMVNEAYTSQTCYKCGNRQKMELSERHYSCGCGYSNDRDVNAALNIMAIGERQRLTASCCSSL